MADIQENETQKQCQEQDSMGAAYPYCAQQENEGDYGKHHQKPAGICRCRFQYTEMPAEENAGQRHPESAVGTKSGETEIIACLELLHASHKLG